MLILSNSSRKDSYAKWSAIYNKVPPALDSVRINSKEKFGILIFFTVLVFFNNLAYDTAIISKLVLVVLSKYSRSSKFLVKEHNNIKELIWNKEVTKIIIIIIFVLYVVAVYVLVKCFIV